jgi:hypothetical protein
LNNIAESVILDKVILLVERVIIITGVSKMKSALEPLLIQRRETSRSAINSFILGIISLPLFAATMIILADTVVKPIYSVLLFVIFFPGLSITALVFGVIAVKKIRKSSNLKGMELAIAGLVVANLTLVGLILLFLYSIYLSHF